VFWLGDAENGIASSLESVWFGRLGFVWFGSVGEGLGSGAKDLGLGRRVGSGTKGWVWDEGFGSGTKGLGLWTR